MSTNNSASLIQRLLTLGAIEFLPKPLSKRKLSSLYRFFHPRSAEPSHPAADKLHVQCNAAVQDTGKQEPSGHHDSPVEDRSVSPATHTATNTALQDSSPLQSTAAGSAGAASTKLAWAAVVPAESFPTTQGISHPSSPVDPASHSSRSPTNTSMMCTAQGAHNTDADNALCRAAAMLSAEAEVRCRILFNCSASTQD
jgi:hypothetical protein